MRIEQNKTILDNKSVAFWFADALRGIRLQRDTGAFFEMTKARNHLSGMIILLEPSPDFRKAFSTALTGEPTAAALESAYLAITETFGEPGISLNEVLGKREE